MRTWSSLILPSARDSAIAAPRSTASASPNCLVPVTQGIAAFNTLQRKGIPSQFLYLPDENHWVLKPADSILWHDTVLAWLDRWLKPR